MQKSLLSAEDIFAMKKDGECAIVVKGTEPLYQKKCQMEKTPFLKLLCRKKNPYDPKKRQERKVRRKSEKVPEILMDAPAREEAKKLRDMGVPIVHMSMEDAMLFAKASRIGMKVDSIVITKEMQEQIEENTRSYEEKLLDKKDFDFTILFNPEASDEQEEKKQYHNRIIEVRKLITAGYSYSQIRGMKPLLMVGYSAVAIKELFGVNEPIDGIKNVIEILEE